MPAPELRSSERVASESAALNELINAHAGRGAGGYDALVLFSGGKDSTYLVHRLREECPRVRLLAMTFDNTFMSPVAKANIERLVAQLDLAHVTVRPARATLAAIYRYCLTHLQGRGGYEVVDFSDGELLLDQARQLAAERGIPLIVCGYSRYQVQNGLQLNHFESPRERELADRTETAGLKLDDIVPRAQQTLWWRGSAWSPERVARLLFPLYAWDLDEEVIKQQVAAWGLLSPKQNNPIVTNHQLIPLLGVVDVHTLGYSSFEVELCRMVRDGKADRRHWLHVFELLEYSAKTGFFVRDAVESTLAQLGLTMGEVGIRLG